MIAIDSCVSSESEMTVEMVVIDLADAGIACPAANNVVDCFLKSESTLVCLCSKGNPRNLLRVFCLSVGSIFFVVLFFCALLREAAPPLIEDNDLLLLLLLLLLLMRALATRTVTDAVLPAVTPRSVQLVVAAVEIVL
jgi:hypothetical protein